MRGSLSSGRGVEQAARRTNYGEGERFLESRGEEDGVLRGRAKGNWDPHAGAEW